MLCYQDNIMTVPVGFFVGKEGPMIHTGAIIGAALPQLRSTPFKIPYAYFRSDRCVYKDTLSLFAGTFLLFANTFCE